MTSPQSPQQVPPSTLPPWWETAPQDGPVDPVPGGAPDGPAGPRRGRRVAVVLVVVLLTLGGVGGVLWWSVGPGSRPGPAEAVAAAIDDLRTWDLISYQGEVSLTGSPDLQIDVTVDRNGDAAGTLTTPDGARAEYARIDGIELIKAEPRWFDEGNRSEDKAARLGGRWVKNPTGEVTGLDSDLMAPGALAADLDTPGLRSRVSSYSPYDEGAPEQVGDVPARRLEGSTTHVLVSEGSEPRLLAVQETIGGAAPTPLRVVPAGPEARAGIDAARTARDSAPDYQARLLQKADVGIEWGPGAMRPCTTPRCSVEVKVTNPESFAARGLVLVSLNGEPVGSRPFELAAHGSEVFTATVNNPGRAKPGTRVPMDWRADVKTY